MSQLQYCYCSMCSNQFSTIVLDHSNPSVCLCNLLQCNCNRNFHNLNSLHHHIKKGPTQRSIELQKYNIIAYALLLSQIFIEI